ncbi:hypothetical protein ACJX0J_026584, partial [Zea mays]
RLLLVWQALTESHVPSIFILHINFMFFLALINFMFFLALVNFGSIYLSFRIIPKQILWEVGSEDGTLYFWTTLLHHICMLSKFDMHADWATFHETS